MFKKLCITLVAFVAFACLAGNSFAATSVRLEQPKSPTNQTSFSLTFVTLDSSGNSVTATCWKQGPGDAAYSQFGGNITLASGGSDNCPVDSSVITTAGSYSFYVMANGTQSNTVTVDYDTSTPGTPTNYNKGQNSSCQYVISFTTANDNGQTVKVELYRSDSTSFSVDDTSRVDTQNIGSNTSGSFTNNVPDCSKSYFYAIRAFNNNGTPSGAVGDSQTTTNTVVIQPTTTQQTTGALVTNNGNTQVNQPTGEGSGTSATSPAPNPTEGQKNVLGTQTKASPTPTKTPIFATVFMQKKTWGIIIVGILILLGLGYYFLKHSQKRSY